MPTPTRCPACGSQATSHAFDARDWALGAAPGEFAYRRCARCGSCFASPQPEEAVLAQAYAAEYGNYQAEPGLLERIAEPLARREARRVVGATDPSAPALEVGCGTGRFLGRLRENGWRGELRGVEYSGPVAEAAAVRLGMPIVPGTAEDAELGESALGALVMRHVIEHLRDPAEVLGRARRALRPDGLLYLATPDANALSAAVFGRFWWGWEVPRHLVVFTPAGLRTLVEAQGFRVTGEWWGFSPQMWNASLFVALNRGGDARWPHLATHTLNPFVTGPAVIAATAEVLLRRSTMYALAARPA